MKTYIINAQGFYFSVDSNVQINFNDLDGCTLYSTLESMQKAAMKMHGQSLEEVEGFELGIEKTDLGALCCDGLWLCNWDSSVEGESLEEFLNNFTL